jgi:O-antigen/teichoic acid export membrane protein
LSTGDFAVWVLVVQIASYVMYLDLGVQTAVSRTVAFRSAGGNLQSVAGPMSAGVYLLFLAGLGGFVLVGLSAVVLPWLVEIPSGLANTARLALVVLGGSAALTLPGSAMHGVLLGLGRNWSSTVAVVGARSFSVGLTIFGAYRGWSIPGLAGCLAVGSVVNSAVPFLIARQLGLPSPWRRPTRADFRELLDIAATAGTWTIAILIISGIDVLVVGIVDVDKISPYGLAAGLVIAGSAAYGITSSILIPAFANHAARSDERAARHLLGRSTALSCTLLSISLMVALAVRSWLIPTWSGQYADAAEPIFVVLMITAVIRLSLSPLAAYAMGFGHHRMVRYPAIVEAVLNLAFSITLGVIVGALGVAIASLVASLSALILYLGRIGPRTIGARQFRALVVTRYAFAFAVAAPFVTVLLLDRRTTDRILVGSAGTIVQLVMLRANITRLSALDNLAATGEVARHAPSGEIAL